MDEIAYGRGHKYLTLVYQIEAGCVRLLWVGKERTAASFEQFFVVIGQTLTACAFSGDLPLGRGKIVSMHQGIH